MAPHAMIDEWEPSVCRCEKLEDEKDKTIEIRRRFEDECVQKLVASRAGKPSDTPEGRIEGIIGARVGVEMQETVRAPAKVIFGCLHEKHKPFCVCVAVLGEGDPPKFEFIWWQERSHGATGSKTRIEGSERGKKGSMKRVMTRTGTSG